MFWTRRFLVTLAVLAGVNLAGWWWFAVSRAPGGPQGLTLVRVMGSLPASNVDQAERLSVVFDQPVQPAGSEVLTDAPPFKISPSVPGQWVWGAPDRLDFVLEEPLPAGRKFEVEPIPALEVQLGRPVQVSNKLVFETRALAVKSCEVVAADRSDITFRLTFNQPVHPDTLLKHLEVRTRERLPGEPALRAVRMLSQQAGETLIARCSRSRSASLEIVLNGELTGHEAERPLGAEQVLSLNLPQAFTGLRAEVSQPGTQRLIQAELHFSQLLNASQTLPSVKVTPPVANLTVRVGQQWDYGADAGRLVLEGAFQPGHRYRVEVPTTLLAADNSILDEPAQFTLDIPEREPAVAFSQHRGILSPQGHLLLDLETVRVGQLRVSATRIHANNLVTHLQHRYWGNLGREVLQKTLSVPGNTGEPQQHALELRPLLQNPLGIYEIEARALDHAWTRDEAIVTITDLGLVAKVEKDSVSAWVGSLKTAQPLAGVTVSAWSYTNQKLASLATDEQGFVRLPVPKDHPDGQAWVLIAEQGADLSYLLLEGRHWLADDVDQSGRPYAENYEVFLYPERGIYRPGEAIHLTGLIRDAAGLVPPPFPLTLNIYRPDGRLGTSRTLTAEPELQGFVHTDIATRDTAATGYYRAEVTLPGSDTVLGETKFQVEAFVPARLKVEVSAPAIILGAQPPEIEVHGQYLFGSAAANLPLQVQGKWTTADFQSQAFPDFLFESPDASVRQSFELPAGTLDAQGQAKFPLKLDAVGQPHRWRASFTATVTEPGGRSISNAGQTTWDPCARHIGLRLKEGRVVPVGTAIPVSYVVRTPQDEAAAGAEFTVHLERIEYDTVLKQSGGYQYWHSEPRPVEVWSGRVKSAGEAAGEFHVTCPTSGSYRINVRDSETGCVTHVTCFASLDTDADIEVPLDQPERLQLTLDKERYLPGETARIALRSPFQGRLLITLETNHVLSQQSLELNGNSHTLEVPIPADIHGSIWLSAAVVRPLQNEAQTWLPHRAFGILRIPADHSAQRLPVEIDVAKQALPGEAISVTVTTPIDPAEATRPAVHLWAVDEGILLTTAHRTPAPHAFFWGPRSRSVLSLDLYGQLLPDQQRPADLSRIGGDGDAEHAVDESRRSLVPPSKIRTTVLWHAARAVDANGVAKFDVTLPEFTGQLRWMAVAAAGPKIGSTQRDQIVTAPLLVELHAPRSVAPGDVFTLPAKVFNTSTESVAVQLAVQAEGPIQLTVPLESIQFTVAAGQSHVVQFPVQAANWGTASLRLVATTSGNTPLKASASADFAVRPATPLDTQTQIVRVEAGQDWKLESPADLLAGTVRTRLTVSSHSAAELLPAVEQLLDYPYGCVEQTSSRLAAVLASTKLLQQQHQVGRLKLADEMIAAGIARLWSLQTRSGGLTYWPGQEHVDPWGTAYAGSVLAIAVQQGHAVDPEFQKSLSDYLQRSLQQELDPPLSLGAKALICRTLSALDRPPVGWLTRLSEQVEALDPGARADLAAAWLLAGRKDQALAVLRPDTISLAVTATHTGRLTSPVEQFAKLLRVTCDLDRDHPWIPVLAGRLLEARRQGFWSTTLENAAAISALSRYERLSPQNQPTDFHGQLLLEDQPQGTFTHVEPFAWSGRQTGPLTVHAEGQGTLFVTTTSTGLRSKSDGQEYDHQLRVRRRWSLFNGQPADPAQIRSGDLVYVDVTLDCAGDGSQWSIPNVAIVDLVPGGFEIEHPRLQTSTTDNTAADTADHVEFLDDRVVLFATAERQPRTYRYALRAVTAGRFTLPPIQAACMYNPGWASIHGHGTVVVQSPSAPALIPVDITAQKDDLK